jgi:ABC-type transporter Mla MlaB component
MLKIDKELIIQNISGLKKYFESEMRKSTSLSVDLSSVSEVDTSGIALLVELKQYAKLVNCILSYENLSSAILKLCKLYKINL